MSEWKKPGEVFGNTPLAILGGRTGAENLAYWREEWRNGRGRCDTGADYALPHGPYQEGLWPPRWKPMPRRKPGAPHFPPPDLPGTLEMHLTRVGIPIRLAEVLRSGPADWPAVKAVRDWCISKAGFLLLHGEPGTGKSVAAASAFLYSKRARILDMALEWDSSGVFVDAADIASNLFTDETKALVEHLEEARLLVVDELGAETMSDPWRGVLETVVNKRYGNPKLKTVLCTNVSTARAENGGYSPFRVRYGERISRRVAEAGMLFAATKP